LFSSTYWIFLTLFLNVSSGFVFLNLPILCERHNIGSNQASSEKAARPILTIIEYASLALCEMGKFLNLNFVIPDLVVLAGQNIRFWRSNFWGDST